MHRLSTQFHLAKLSLHKTTAVKLLNHGQREVCGEHKDCFSRCASCPARLQMKKPSQELQKLRHGNKWNPFPWHRRQRWESGPATCREQEATLPPAPAPFGCRRRWRPLCFPCTQVWTSRTWCGGEKSGQHLANSQTGAWSSSCYSQEGLFAGSVPERGLRKFSANVIAFLICMRNK